MAVSKNFYQYCLTFSLALIWVLCIQKSVQAETYYVTENGNDSNPGTEAQPWLTLSKADSAASSGDIVYVKEGTYSGLFLTKSGITYKSHPSNATRPKTGEWYFGSGVSNVIMDGFDITDNGPLHENANCDNIMRNCWIHDAYMGWDVTQGSHRNIAENCRFDRCHYAFHTSGTNNIGNIIRNCEIYDSIDDGINVSPVATDTQIINNIVANSGDNGIHCFGANSIIKGNLVYGSKGVGLWAAGGNTIVRNNTVVGISGTSYNTLFWLEKSGNEVKNNIFYVDSPNEALFFSEGSGDIDYNCWYNPQNPMSPIGSNGIAIDPKFVDIPNNDYRLQPDSPCIGTGEGGVDMGALPTGVPPPPPTNQAPIANAGSEQTVVDSNEDASEQVVLNGSGSSDPDGSIISFVWAEGGVEIATGISPTVTLSVGIHNIILTVTDDGGLTDTDAVTITVSSPPNQAPVADAGPDQTVTDNDGNGSEEITLDGSGSSDPDGTITNYIWTEGGAQIAAGVKPIVVLSVGTHTIVLTVTDDKDSKGTDTVVVTVSPPAPVQPVLALNPTSLDFGASETNLSITVKNTGAGALNWSASENLDWLSLDKASGSSGAGSSESVRATVSRAGKSPGAYNGTISFTSNGGNQDVSVSMTVPEPAPALSVSPILLDFGISEISLMITITNTGGGTLSWNASGNLDWLSLNKTSGSLGAGSSESVTATVSRSGKSPGAYNGTMSFTSNGGNQDVSVSMTVLSPEVPDPPDDNPEESKPLSGEPVNGDPPDEKENGVRNRPNPFRAGKEVTLIRYNLKQPSNVTITIYNLLGQEVWSESYEAGENGGREDNSVPWDGKNLSGEVVGNGGYLCRIQVDREKKDMIRKIAVVK